jgi:VanZ family protein
VPPRDVHRVVRRLRRLAPALGAVGAVGWPALIFALSSIPGTDIPSAPIPSADKLVHLGLYGVLGFLWFRCARAWPASAKATASSPRPARRSTWVSTWVWTVVAVLAYGISDELHQAFVPLRSPDILDVLADLVGGALGASLAVARATRRRERPPIQIAEATHIDEGTPPTVNQPPPR